MLEKYLPLEPPAQIHLAPSLFKSLSSPYTFLDLLDKVTRAKLCSNTFSILQAKCPASLFLGAEG
jgi:hypothetical protein